MGDREGVRRGGQALRRFLDDGRLRIDNNSSEREQLTLVDDGLRHRSSLGAGSKRPSAPVRLVGDAGLEPPSSARGIAVKIGDGGEIVVVGEKTILLDLETTMQSPNQDQTATSEVVLDAPLIVRVEVGAVTLTASEWAALGPGDVVAVGRRVNDPVLLRIAGAEVARGELVDIEGELGVRIRERARST